MIKDGEAHCDECDRVLGPGQADLCGGKVLCPSCSDILAGALRREDQGPLLSLVKALKGVDWVVGVFVTFILLWTEQYVLALAPVAAAAHLHVVLSAAEAVLTAYPLPQPESS